MTSPFNLLTERLLSSQSRYSIRVNYGGIIIILFNQPLSTLLQWIHQKLILEI